MFFFLVGFILRLVLVLLAVAFFTLLERKGLAYSQTRKGPDKNFLGGFLQPILDALKLLTKRVQVPHQVSPMFFYTVPGIFFFLIIQIWTTFPGIHSNSGFFWGIIIFISISGLSSIVLLIIGVRSFSKFGVLGGLRGVAQGVSYEIIFSLVIFSSLALYSRGRASSSVLNPRIFFLPLWWVCAIAEANRSPFDFAEGESELIRGFNIEYRGGPFVIIFLGEYGFVLGVRLLTSKIFFSFSILPSIILFFLAVITRGLFPRFRYDFLIGVCWFILLPLVLIFCGTILYFKFCPPGR